MKKRKERKKGVSRPFAAQSQFLGALQNARRGPKQLVSRLSVGLGQLLGAVQNAQAKCSLAGAWSVGHCFTNRSGALPLTVVAGVDPCDC
jgi:hypothetical protein